MDYHDIISQASIDYQVPYDLVKSVITVESNFNPLAVGTSGEQGLMQLMPGTARDLGVLDAFDPVQNIRGGVRYLRQQYQNAGNWRDALARYNAGKYYKGSQGQAYADKVINVYKNMSEANQSSNTAGAQAVQSSDSGAAGSGTDLAWYDKILLAIKNFFVDNALRIALVLLAIIIIIFGVWKLINS